MSKKSQNGKPAASPRKPSQNEIARQLAPSFASTLAFDSDTGEWRMYQDAVWTKAKKVHIQQIIREAIHSRFTSDFSINFAQGVTQFLMGDLYVDKWDNEVCPDLIPFPNGTLNIRTHEFTPSHDPMNRITWQLPYDFNKDATCPTIHKWLLEATKGDKELIELIRAFFLAVLLGRYDLQRYMEIVGPGGSGKGTLTRLLTSMIGEPNYYITTMKYLEENRFETAAIQGKRLVLINDASKYGGEGSIFKSLTGQDKLRKEVKNKQQDEAFTFTGMVVIAANAPIYFSDTSSAIARRRISARLDHVVHPSKRRNLSEDFEGEIPGLLNWVLGMDVSRMESLLRNTDHLVKSSQDAKMATLIETNPLIAWLSQNVEFSPEVRVQVGALGVSTENMFELADNYLYPNFIRWCKQNGRKGQISTNTFSTQLEEVITIILGVDGVERKRQMRVPGEKTRSGFIGLKIVEGTENSIVEYAFKNEGLGSEVTESVDGAIAELAEELCTAMEYHTGVQGVVVSHVAKLLATHPVKVARVICQDLMENESNWTTDWLGILEEKAKG
jgi:putative DNA primase/helicase